MKKRILPAWYTLVRRGKRRLSKILFLWTRAECFPQSLDDLKLDLKLPIYYALESDALFSQCVLERETARLGLPSPLQACEELQAHTHRSMFFMQRRDGWIVRRLQVRSYPKTLGLLVDAIQNQDVNDIQIIPVSVLLGRNPDKDGGLLRNLFSENWVFAGRLRKLFSIFIYGRNTFIEFSSPLSLAKIVAENQGRERSIRKTARLARASIRGIREAAIGPDLSHKRTMIGSILASTSVKQAIERESNAGQIKKTKIRKRAAKYINEIAADYSYNSVRFASQALTYLWQRIYDGVEVNHLDGLRKLATNHEIVYIPCHRSHIDYLLLSYLLYRNGFVAPHIAAGSNLNLPILGKLLRRGGAFFLRRSFRNNRLYSSVFHEYVSTIFQRGVSIEFFIEGTRSRTGRLTDPKLGLLAMMVRSYLSKSSRPVVFQPVYIGYEKLAEGRSYIGELSGKKKNKESLFGLFKSINILRSRFGRVHVNFGQAVHLNQALENHNPDWRNQELAPDFRPEWLHSLVDHIAQDVTEKINQAVDVNPVNLLAYALLATPRNAIAIDTLIEQIDLMKRLLKKLPFSDQQTLTEMPASEIVSYVVSLGFIQIQSNPLGDIVLADEENAILLTYFRNNIIHVLALPSWIAACFSNNRKFNKSRLLTMGRFLYPFLKSELFLPWSHESFSQQCCSFIDFFVEEQLLTDIDGELERPVGSTLGALRISLISDNILKTLERYYITVSLLANAGSGTISQRELEELCKKIAQRLSILNAYQAPEFFDKALFRNFINTLLSESIINVDSSKKLLFGEQLTTMTTDAKLILNKQIRHGILQLTDT